MFGSILLIVIHQALLYLFGLYLTVCGWQCQHLMSAMFYGTRLMNGNMSGGSSYSTLIRSEYATDDSCIGLRTAYQKVHVGFRSLACLTD